MPSKKKTQPTPETTPATPQLETPVLKLETNLEPEKISSDFVVGDIIQVTHRENQFRPQLGIVHSIGATTLKCYYPKKNGPVAFVVDKSAVTVVGKAAIKWERPL